MNKLELEEMVAAAKRLRSTLLTPDDAKRLLIEEGVINADGKLTQYYRGTAAVDVTHCAGGYLVRGRHLCGRSGNNCRNVCAFEYRR